MTAKADIQGDQTGGGDRETAPPLSRRELEVLRLSSGGLTAASAARVLGVTEATVKFHLAGARRKLGVKNTAQAVSRLHTLQLTAQAEA